jgi:plastocyanin
MVLLLAIAATSLQDVEAAALAVGGAVALGLLRFRTGLLGILGLTVLSADVAAWMAPGAYSNLSHGEGLWETALPSTLTIAAVSTVVSCVAALVERRAERSSSAGPRLAQFITLALGAIAIVVSAIGLGEAAVEEAGDLRITTEDVRFDPTTLESAPGQIGVVVENRDLFWHTFTIEELDVNVSVPVGAERRTAFEAAPGTYKVICAIPGHEQAGMKGTLVVRQP